MFFLWRSSKKKTADTEPDQLEPEISTQPEPETAPDTVFEAPQDVDVDVVADQVDIDTLDPVADEDTLITPEVVSDDEVQEAEKNAQTVFLTSQNYPVYYLPITKCGCTFLKNLFHHFDHGSEHPDGSYVHATESGLMRATDVPAEDILNSPHVFTVLRNPAERFESLYFDKIYGNGPQNFPHIRDYLANTIGLELDRDIPLEVHRENALVLAEWLGENLRGETPIEKNFHWRPQAGRVHRIKGFDPVFLTLDGLNWQLPMLLGDVIPDIEDQMAAVASRNESHYPVAKGSILTEEVVNILRQVYAKDFALYETARDEWAPYAPQMVSAPSVFRIPGSPFVRALSPVGHPEIAAVLTPKCGSHLLTTLFTYLGGGQPPVQSQYGAAPEFGFVVIREPVDRLHSFMRDGVMRKGRHIDATTQRRIEAALERPVQLRAQIDTYRENLAHLAQTIKRGMPRLPGRGGTLYRPQYPAVMAAQEKGFEVVPLAHLDFYLDEILGPVWPQSAPPLHEILSDPEARYPSRASLTTEQVSTPELADMIRNVYRTDAGLYDQALADFEGGAHHHGTTQEGAAG